MPYTTTDQHESGASASRVESMKARFRPLHGMKAICAYLEKSESTVFKYIKEEGLPAAKIGGQWVSDEGRIDDWRLSRIG
ncbi:MAG: helix-turn-helix domain-containing protein [Deltaproteobacteria bacterium]|jgi:predicted DNA-binding transcriptional regulator AlpA|nr:helix-turn-helix domain-containing protein [Deltaproteobacteria bacterium]